MISLKVPQVADLKPRIAVVGVGGAGGNAVNNMIAGGLEGVEYIVANTDAQALIASSAERRIQLGATLTEGLGAGAKPERGEAAAEEATDEITSQLTGCHMVFIAAGMGGGTGTGAAPVIARIARELGILTVAIVTKPFQFEGTNRMRMAEAGIKKMREHVDTLIVIPNHNLFKLANERTGFREAFVMADQVLFSGISCIVDLIVKDGLINLDLADVRTVLSDMGTAMMGTGERQGENRALLAAEDAIMNPLLDDINLATARGLIISIIGGEDLKLHEVDVAANRIRREVSPDANIIVGTALDKEIKDGSVRISIVASGMNDGRSAGGQAPFVGLPAEPISPPPQPLPVMAVQGPISQRFETAPAAPVFTPPPPSPLEQVTRLDQSPWADMVGAGPAPAVDYGAPQAYPPKSIDVTPQAPPTYGSHAPQPQPVAPQRVTHPAPAVWQAPDNVEIEEKPPVLFDAPGRQQDWARSSDTFSDQTVDVGGFVPQPTHDIRLPRARSAEIGDFSVHAQAVYRGQPVQSATTPPMDARPQDQHAKVERVPDEASDQKRGSLLWRIAAGGLRRR
jgi:cell division protein FtsZ